ncbi:MAG: signal recognition particle [Methanobacteriota archaeon]|nr:MAG: signal recognition particle [Euryarchaeota archaeon]
MSSKKPTVIFPEYFDVRLKRSEGRKVPASEAVKSPNIDELSIILSKLDCDFTISKGRYPGNWSNSKGCLKVKAQFSKTQLLHKLGAGLKELRKTN